MSPSEFYTTIGIVNLIYILTLWITGRQHRREVSILNEASNLWKLQAMNWRDIALEYERNIPQDVDGEQDTDSIEP
jgi:hypothetical protein